MAMMQQLLEDARSLLAHFKAQERAVDNLLSQASSLKNSINEFKQYRQEVEELNDSAGRRPKTVLAHGAAHESTRVQSLEQENSDLRTSVMAYQQAMKIVMTKFKEQREGLALANHQDRKVNAQQDRSQEIKQRNWHIKLMAGVIEESINVDNKAEASKEKRFQQLQDEIKAMRQLLEESTVPDSLDEEYARLTGTLRPSEEQARGEQST